MLSRLFDGSSVSTDVTDSEARDMPHMPPDLDVAHSFSPSEGSQSYLELITRTAGALNVLKSKTSTVTVIAHKFVLSNLLPATLLPMCLFILRV